MTVWRSKLAWLAAAALLAVLAAGWFGFSYATGFFLDQTAQRGGGTLRLTVAGLRGALNRYRPLSELIADNGDIKRFLAAPKAAGMAGRINRELKKVNAVVQASDIYVMDRHGLTLAASNFDTATSFVGNNFSYRPYFQDAVAGKPGRYFALGTTSLKRGYYFASAVRDGGKITGVVAVKVNIDEIEAAWRGTDHEVIVADGNGIVFMSSRAAWRFAALRALSPEALAAIKATQQYAGARLTRLPVTEQETIAPGRRLITIETGGRATQYLIQSEAMPEAGWTVFVLTDTASVKTQAYTSVAVAVLVLLIAMLAAAYFIQRRHRLMERMAVQREAREELERRVAERTADLNRVNTKLVREVTERRATEVELRKTQADLIQAGKLAALGQMSAGLSHEFNQPLGAAKSYADNAAAFLDRGREAEARDNITRISTLIDRMASISKHLRNFARKPEERLTAVPLATVINDAVEILVGRIKSRSATVSVGLPHEELWVKGGQVRLQQVLVNLINNALDAMEGSTAPLVEIRAHADAGRVTVTVRDFGAGVAAGVAPQIFDPFFTTKGVSKGLGLGLSISYNIIKDFGGNLGVSNHPDGGAVFTIELERAVKTAEAMAG